MTIVSDTPNNRRVTGTPKVHVTRRLLPSVEARMSDLFEVVLNSEDRPLSRAELIAAMREADVIVPTVTDRIDAAMLAAAGDRLGRIANFGAGTEHIDLVAARARKLIVTNTPGVFTDDTADLAMMLILSVPRRLGEGSQLIRDGQGTGWTPTAMLGLASAASGWGSSAWAGSARRWRTARAPSGWMWSITIATACPPASRACSVRAMNPTGKC